MITGIEVIGFKNDSLVFVNNVSFLGFIRDLIR